MLYAFIVFFFLMYCICERFKYARVATIKNKDIKHGKLYEKPVVYIKLVFIVLSFILAIINRLSASGIVERSSGFQGFLFITLFFLVFIGISILDVYKVVHGHNEKLLEGEEK